MWETVSASRIQFSGIWISHMLPFNVYSYRKRVNTHTQTHAYVYTQYAYVYTTYKERRIANQSKNTLNCTLSSTWWNSEAKYARAHYSNNEVLA